MEARETPYLHEDARRDLAAFYEAVDRAVAETEAVCRLRGICCDFHRSGHRLYATSLEIAYAKEANPEPLETDGVLCPFWKDGMCTERARRPLGCRIYFCDPAKRDALEALYERFHGELKLLSERHGIPYSYRPFVEGLTACEIPCRT